MSDFTGSSATLAGTQVLVNGATVPVLAASRGRVDFLCPTLPAGTALSVSVQNNAGSSDPAATTMQDVSVGVFSADGSGKGQGTVFLAGTSLLATGRSYLNLGQPALAGDSITVRATGFGNAGSVLPMVRFADLYARADAINPVAGMAGVYDITVTVPPGVPVGQAIPLSIISPSAPGSVCSSGMYTPGTWPWASSGSCSSGARTGDGPSSNTVDAAFEAGS